MSDHVAYMFMSWWVQSNTSYSTAQFIDIVPDNQAIIMYTALQKFGIT